MLAPEPQRRMTFYVQTASYLYTQVTVAGADLGEISASFSVTSKMAQKARWALISYAYFAPRGVRRSSVRRTSSERGELGGLHALGFHRKDCVVVTVREKVTSLAAQYQSSKRERFQTQLSDNCDT